MQHNERCRSLLILHNIYVQIHVELSSLTEGWRSTRDSLVTLNNGKCHKHILDHYRLKTKINSRVLMKSMKTPEVIPNSRSLSLHET